VLAELLGFAEPAAAVLAVGVLVAELQALAATMATATIASPLNLP
jgi:hypothetical protein